MPALTLRAGAGLAVAALRGGGLGVGVTSHRGVQVPLRVGADHLTLPRARAAAHGALREETQGD